MDYMFQSAGESRRQGTRALILVDLFDGDRLIAEQTNKETPVKLNVNCNGKTVSVLLAEKQFTIDITNNKTGTTASENNFSQREEDRSDSRCSFGLVQLFDEIPSPHKACLALDDGVDSCLLLYDHCVVKNSNSSNCSSSYSAELSDRHAFITYSLANNEARIVKMVIHTAKARIYLDSLIAGVTSRISIK